VQTLAAAPKIRVPPQPARPEAMKALAANTQCNDDTRLWSPSLVDAVGSGISRQDPLAQLLAEQRRDRTMLRLMLCATASLLILGVGAGLLL
jgi:hypothetical protein